MSISQSNDQVSESVINNHGARKQNKRCDENNTPKHSFKKSGKLKAQVPEINQSKITNYMILSNSHSNLNFSNSQEKNSYFAKIKQMEKRFKEKEDQIVSLKQQNNKEKQKYYALLHDKNQEKLKIRKQTAEAMLEMAKLKRVERSRINQKLGYYIDNCRIFVEGSDIISLRKQIKENEQNIKKIEDLRRKSGLKEEELTRQACKLQYLIRANKSLKNEYSIRQKEVIVYQSQLKLIHKQNNSQYCKKDWPIIYEKFQTLELLGSGGFGQVYKCYDLQNNRIVAIKKIVLDFKNSTDAHKREYYKHLRRQAQIHKRLDHPNIARLYNILQINQISNQIAFQIEYCSGPQLSVYFKKNKCLEQKQAKSIVKQLFFALNYLYNLKEKVIHYDLKPGNIMFHEGIIKILDFGLCKIIEDSEDTRIDLTSQGVGTYWYLPPQTFEYRNPKISSKVDVWSVGVIFFEILYGMKPFGQGVNQSRIYKEGLILNAIKVNWPSQNPKGYKVSSEAKIFIEACLKYNADERLTPSEALNHQYFKK